MQERIQLGVSAGWADGWGPVLGGGGCLIQGAGRYNSRASSPPSGTPNRFPVARRGISHHPPFLLSTAGTV